MEKKPKMLMLAGPNGAGKSTLYNAVIKDKFKAEFINADVIQKNELKDQSMEGAYAAAKIAEERRQAHLKDKKSFVSESTFSHPSKLELIDDAKKHGFDVVMFHVNVRSPDLSVKRVESRAKSGGHDVPEDKIRARYERNQSLIREAALKSKQTYVYDNSQLKQAPTLAIKMQDGVVTWASDKVPTWARELYKDDLKHISKSAQNPAAHSYSEIKAIAKELGKTDNPNVQIPKAGRTYQGRIVGESSMHLLQRTSEKNDYVAHFKDNLKDKAKFSDNVSVKYLSKSTTQVSPLNSNENKHVSAFQQHLDKRNIDKVSQGKLLSEVDNRLSQTKSRSNNDDIER